MMLVESSLRWEQMDGDTDAVKKINSILTYEFILEKKVPADECLVEAEEIVNLDSAEEELEDFLYDAFGDLARGTQLERVAEEILEVLEEEEEL
jgi:hypothetical protein